MTNFQTAIQSALQAKRSALNVALQTFHDGLVALMTQRNSGVESAFTSRLNAFKAVEQKAESDCAAGVAPSTVRTDLIAVLKNAQSSFASVRKATSGFSAQVKSLVDAKNAAIKKAQTDFQAAVQAARDVLKAALGKNQATSTATSTR